ncbi:hypothetical protein [Azotosporobacter soli]|uniref:hypothetical protein n=1 Tax=Azotosporobacter soli TaxID=3055040 RepID=UPI0031FF1BC6
MNHHLQMLRRAALFCAVLLSFFFSASAAEPVEVLKYPYQVQAGYVLLPWVEGMADKDLQGFVNRQLLQSVLELADSASESSLNGNFDVSFYNENMIGIRFSGYSYLPRAAHPTKLERGIHVDLRSGKRYSLAELFKADVDYHARIKELCGQEGEPYRVTTGLPEAAWTYRSFAAAWDEPEEIFLLGSDGIRVYAVPSFAQGAISGYQIPYEKLMDVIDRQGELWQAISSKKAQPVTWGASRQNNKFNKDQLQVGDRVAGLLTRTVERNGAYLSKAVFFGEIELSGTGAWSNDSGDGRAYLLTVDRAYERRLPRWDDWQQESVIRLDAGSDAKLLAQLPESALRIKVVIADYSLGERQILRVARLVKVREIGLR